MLKPIEYLKANTQAEQSIDLGKGISHAEAKKIILARIHEQCRRIDPVN